MKWNSRFYGLLFTALFWVVACQQNTNEKDTNDQQELVDHSASQSLNEGKALVLPYIAEVNDETSEVYLKENPQRSPIPLTKEELAEALNIKYPEITIQAGEIKTDTLHITIPDPTFLTQQSGTTGAQTYLAEATFAFTELPEVRVVFFDFKEGDHAVPGPYTRSSFKKI